jgi:endo-1,4-beta-xylanase
MQVYNMLASMKSRGIPVDGVGLQMHISVDNYPPFADVAWNIARLGALGLEVHITEVGTHL